MLCRRPRILSIMAKHGEESLRNEPFSSKLLSLFRFAGIADPNLALHGPRP